MERITYEWIRSRRRTIAVQIREDGSVALRTPYSVSRAQAERFIEEHKEWILENQRNQKEA